MDNVNVNNLEVKTTQQEFATRSLVQLEIFDDKNTPDLDYSTLSVAVVDENALNANRGSQNILSYLLLDSELRGFIESPADYFVDDDNITSQEKLNLLMLTHGWSRYLRNSFKENSVNIEYQKTAGFLIKGKAALSFFTADDLAYYRIIVEGVTNNGHICLGSAKFAVNRRNERLED